ncbi:MAG: DUF3047 domain-containing protein [Pseudomonadales bacterium]|nr:DUF3047 domain-containing protein [Pseudomonadales bacterium]
MIRMLIHSFLLMLSLFNVNCRAKHHCFALLIPLIAALQLAPFISASAHADIIPISEFDSEPLSAWKAKSFKGETKYSIVELDNQKVLQANSIASASGLAKEMTIDLKKTPYLNWCWKTRSRLSNLKETEKKGDDYTARIYVVIDGGWKIWETKALNYVWSSNQAKGSRWDNAFAGNNAKMIAVDGVENKINQWQCHKRNVYEDLGEAFAAGESNHRYTMIDVIAIMTDTDNSEGKAISWYRDIYFSAN